MSHDNCHPSIFGKAVVAFVPMWSPRNGCPAAKLMLALDLQVDNGAVAVVVVAVVVVVVVAAPAVVDVVVVVVWL